MRRVFRDNGLSLVLGACFFVFLAGQSLTGHKEHNENRLDHGGTAIGYRDYLGTSHFWESVFENWESEFLQMGFYVLLTVFLRQKGSSESKKIGVGDAVDEDPRKARKRPNVPAAVLRGGWKLKLYEHSLSLAFLLLFIFSFLLHAVSSLKYYNQEQLEHGHPPTTLEDYLWGSRFWFESLQNWQSEFLAVLAIVVLSIFLRERGSPESKPVAAPHAQTGS